LKECHNAVKRNIVSKTVEIEVTENIAILRFNRGKALNALNVKLARGIVLRCR
jgi:enoyl-CoA hydratase/carnithine racemase